MGDHSTYCGWPPLKRTYTEVRAACPWAAWLRAVCLWATCLRATCLRPACSRLTPSLDTPCHTSLALKDKQNETEHEKFSQKFVLEIPQVRPNLHWISWCLSRKKRDLINQILKHLWGFESTWNDHGRMARGGHGLPKVLLGHAMPSSSMPYGWPPLKWPYGHFRGGHSLGGQPAAVFHPLGYLTSHASDRQKMGRRRKCLLGLHENRTSLKMISQNYTWNPVGEGAINVTVLLIERKKVTQ
jgi:hypothetical protein